MGVALTNRYNNANILALQHKSSNVIVHGPVEHHSELLVLSQIFHSYSMRTLSKQSCQLARASDSAFAFHNKTVLLRNVLSDSSAKHLPPLSLPVKMSRHTHCSPSGGYPRIP